MSCLLKHLVFLLTILFLITISLRHSVNHNNENNNDNNNNEWRIYESWLVKHNEKYNAIGKKERRFQIFKDNLRFIDELNNNDNNNDDDNNNNNDDDEESTKYYKLGLNKFADLTVDEFRSLYRGMRKGQNDKTAVEQPHPRVAIGDDAREFQFYKSSDFTIARETTYLRQPSTSNPSREATVACDSYNSCPSGNTCCCIYTYGPYCISWGCCPKESAICCDDGSRCCPRDYPICNTNGSCSKKKNCPLSVKALERTPAILHIKLRLATWF